MSNQALENLKILLQTPDLASRRWIYEQYDSQVMNDTIQTGGDASMVRVHSTEKALAITTDCTPRYVEADPFEGAKQAVAETYRNISATGAKPLAITNCLNFGNPQKPEIMGQIVRAIKGITQSSTVLDYPVVSGNVSLYNETDGKAIQPAPAIGGVGLIKNYHKRCHLDFKHEKDEVYVIGKNSGHVNVSLFEREIMKTESKTYPPRVHLHEEKKHGEFVRDVIENSDINACHDVSDGGLLVALFEMCGKDLGCNIDISQLKAESENIDENHLLFGEDQARYIVALNPSSVAEFKKKAELQSIPIIKIATVIKKEIKIGDAQVSVEELRYLNESVLPKKFS